MKSFLRLFLASALLAPAAIFAASFEGKVTMTMKSGKEKPMDITYALKGDKMRIEFPNQKGKAGMVMDTSKKQMLMIMDEQKMYMTYTIPETVVQNAEKQTAQTKFEKTNETEKILGYTATKYIATSPDGITDIWLAEGLGRYMSFNQNPMGRGRGAATPQGWEQALAGKDLFPLRVVGKDKKNAETFRMEVTAIQKESLPESLFTPPADYKSFDMGGMMKGIMQGIGR
jgi:hypothetical protein